MRPGRTIADGPARAFRGAGAHGPTSMSMTIVRRTPGSSRALRPGWCVVALALLASAPAAGAQPADQQPAGSFPVAESPPPAPSPDPQQLRYQMRVLEGVLESAVQHGAQLINSQLRQVSPDLMLFSGPPRARGFRLEGYGVFFSVDVPRVRASVMWSFRTLNQSGVEVGQALQRLRRYVQSTNDSRTRTDLEQALRLVELQVGPLPPMAAGTGPAGGSPPAGASASAAGADVVATAPEVMRNPDAAYEAEVKRALIDAMLDHGPAVHLGTDEWLTVAAREHEDSTFTGELSYLVTITLRVRARDLQAFKTGQISREEARQRVELAEF
jgi:hypothetical protein